MTGLGGYQLATGNLAIVRANLGNRIALVSGMPAVADIAVTGMMFFALWKTKKLGVSSLSNKVVRRLVRICLETNVITSVSFLAVNCLTAYPLYSSSNFSQ